MCKYNFFFIRTFVEQCSAAMACILDDFGLPSDCVVVVFVVLHLVRIRWGGNFNHYPMEKGRRMYYDCWECWLWRGGCMTFQIICMILFSFHILKRVDFFIFIPALFFPYLRLLLLSCGCFLCVSCFGGESTIKKSLSWFRSSVKATIDLLFKRHSNGVFIWTEKK